jgi:mRNA interferase RelE/StbE
MTYQVIADPPVQKRLRKIFKKDRKTYDQLKKKLVELGQNPDIGNPLRNVLKNRRRLQIGSFVLVYKVDTENEIITLLEFDHHDKVYKSKS